MKELNNQIILREDFFKSTIQAIPCNRKRPYSSDSLQYKNELGLDIVFSNFNTSLSRSKVYFSAKGELLPFSATYYAHLDSIEPSKTKVTILAIKPKVRIGLQLLPLPHGVRPYKYTPVAPTTIEEYSLLSLIGLVVKEKNMPSIIYPNQDFNKLKDNNKLIKKWVFSL